MRTYFSSIVVKDFPGEFKKELIQTNSARLGNSDYLQFAALVYGDAASLGWTEAAGGAARHKYRKFRGSHTDPIHLLALDGYLAKINIETARQKKQIAKNFERDFGRALNRDEIEKVWGIVPEIEQGQVKQILTPRNLRIPAPRVRVCIPDLDRMQQVASFELSSDKAGQINAGEFVTTLFPMVEKIYGGLLNPRKVFFGTGEKWAA